MIADLQRVWLEHPDLRLGQLIANAAYSTGTRDLFNIEDDVLRQGFAAVQALLEANKNDE